MLQLLPQTAAAPQKNRKKDVTSPEACIHRLDPWIVNTQRYLSVEECALLLQGQAAATGMWEERIFVGQVWDMPLECAC